MKRLIPVATAPSQNGSTQLKESTYIDKKKLNDNENKVNETKSNKTVTTIKKNHTKTTATTVSTTTTENILEQTPHDALPNMYDEEIKKTRKDLKYPISDDTFDFMESQVDTFNETKNLGEKIQIHSKLEESVKNLGREIDEMASILDNDKLDTDAVNEDIAKNGSECNDGSTDINEDVINIEKILKDMKEEEIMQIKVLHYQKIIEKIKFCKSKCDSSKMRIAKCN
jgi:hypothetical protein